MRPAMLFVFVLALVAAPIEAAVITVNTPSDQFGENTQE